MMREEGRCGWVLHTHTGQGACMELTTTAPREERKTGEGNGRKSKIRG